MAKARTVSLYAQTIAVVRAVVLAFTGNEPPLEAFVPKAYLPKASEPEFTAEEIEATRIAKQKMDIEIRQKHSRTLAKRMRR
jgi:uncharacterized secreted protein with C-terminal beta-propeller domain